MKKALKKQVIKNPQRDCQDEFQDCCCYCVCDPCGCCAACYCC